MKYLSNTSKYDDLIYYNTICSVEDYVNSKLDNIHAKLFDDALNSWFIENKQNIEDNEIGHYENIDDLLNDFSICENKGEEFFNPSNLSLMQKKTPHTILKVNLSKWWNNIQDKILVKKNLNDKLIDEEAKTYAEVVYIDYVNHRTKIRNRMTDEEYWIDNNYVTPDMKLSEEFTLSNTFGEMLKIFE